MAAAQQSCISANYACLHVADWSDRRGSLNFCFDDNGRVDCFCPYSEESEPLNLRDLRREHFGESVQAEDSRLSGVVRRVFEPSRFVSTVDDVILARPRNKDTSRHSPNRNPLPKIGDGWATAFLSQIEWFKAGYNCSMVLLGPSKSEKRQVLMGKSGGFSYVGEIAKASLTASPPSEHHDPRPIVYVSFVEIRNNTLYDLLDEESPAGSSAASSAGEREREKKSLLLHLEGGPEVPDASRVAVSSVEDVQRALDFGRLRRACNESLIEGADKKGLLRFSVHLAFGLCESQPAPSTPDMGSVKEPQGTGRAQQQKGRKEKEGGGKTGTVQKRGNNRASRSDPSSSSSPNSPQGCGSGGGQSPKEREKAAELLKQMGIGPVVCRYDFLELPCTDIEEEHTDLQAWWNNSCTQLRGMFDSSSGEREEAQRSERSFRQELRTYGADEAALYEDPAVGQVFVAAARVFSEFDDESLAYRGRGSPEFRGCELFLSSHSKTVGILREALCGNSVNLVMGFVSCRSSSQSEAENTEGREKTEQTKEEKDNIACLRLLERIGSLISKPRQNGLGVWLQGLAGPHEESIRVISQELEREKAKERQREMAGGSSNNLSARGPRLEELQEALQENHSALTHLRRHVTPSLYAQDLRYENSKGWHKRSETLRRSASLLSITPTAAAAASLSSSSGQQELTSFIPFLENVTADPSTDGIQRLPIFPGRRVTVGSDPERADSFVGGLGVRRKHFSVWQSEREKENEGEGGGVELIVRKEEDFAGTGDPLDLVVAGEVLEGGEERRVREGDLIVVGCARALRVVTSSPGTCSSPRRDLSIWRAAVEGAKRARFGHKVAAHGDARMQKELMDGLDAAYEANLLLKSLLPEGNLSCRVRCAREVLVEEPGRRPQRERERGDAEGGAESERDRETGAAGMEEDFLITIDIVRSLPRCLVVPSEGRDAEARVWGARKAVVTSYRASEFRTLMKSWRARFTETARTVRQGLFRPTDAEALPSKYSWLLGSVPGTEEFSPGSRVTATAVATISEKYMHDATSRLTGFLGNPSFLEAVVFPNGLLPPLHTGTGGLHGVGVGGDVCGGGGGSSVTGLEETAESEHHVENLAALEEQYRRGQTPCVMEGDANGLPLVGPPLSLTPAQSDEVALADGAGRGGASMGVPEVREAGRGGINLSVGGVEGVDEGPQEAPLSDMMCSAVTGEALSVSSSSCSSSSASSVPVWADPAGLCGGSLSLPFPAAVNESPKNRTKYWGSVIAGLPSKWSYNTHRHLKAEGRGFPLMDTLEEEEVEVEEGIGEGGEAGTEGEKEKERTEEKETADETEENAAEPPKEKEERKKENATRIHPKETEKEREQERQEKEKPQRPPPPTPEESQAAMPRAQKKIEEMIKSSRNRKRDIDKEKTTEEILKANRSREREKIIPSNADTKTIRPPSSLPASSGPSSSSSSSSLPLTSAGRNAKGVSSPSLSVPLGTGTGTAAGTGGGSRSNSIPPAPLLSTLTGRNRRLPFSLLTTRKTVKPRKPLEASEAVQASDSSPEPCATSSAAVTLSLSQTALSVDEEEMDGQREKEQKGQVEGGGECGRSTTSSVKIETEKDTASRKSNGVERSATTGRSETAAQRSTDIVRPPADPLALWVPRENFPTPPSAAAGEDSGAEREKEGEDTEGQRKQPLFSFREKKCDPLTASLFSTSIANSKDPHMKEFSIFFKGPRGGS